MKKIIYSIGFLSCIMQVQAQRSTKVDLPLLYEKVSPIATYVEKLPTNPEDMELMEDEGVNHTESKELHNQNISQLNNKEEEHRTLKSLVVPENNKNEKELRTNSPYP